LTEKGYNHCVIHELRDIKNPDLIITITGRYFLVAKLRFPKAKTIYWAQGVGAEEAKMSAKGIMGFLRYRLRLLAEAKAVNTSDILFCVSRKMVEYYTEKYGFNNFDRCVIMPCYNLPISQYFNETQYEFPTFAYAGGSSKWQGVDFMLDVYRKVEEQITTSKLIICTGEQQLFEQKIKARNINNYEIKYVPLNQLHDELHKYKYGFILRDDHIVNQVATPTKMNSYLANYMIPIYSDSVQDFRDHIQLGEFQLMAKTPMESAAVANQIVDFEKSEHDFLKYKDVVIKIFDLHYNDNRYNNVIKSKIDRWL